MSEANNILWRSRTVRKVERKLKITSPLYQKYPWYFSYDPIKNHSWGKNMKEIHGKRSKKKSHIYLRRGICRKRSEWKRRNSKVIHTRSHRKSKTFTRSNEPAQKITHIPTKICEKKRGIKKRILRGVYIRQKIHVNCTCFIDEFKSNGLTFVRIQYDTGNYSINLCQIQLLDPIPRSSAYFWSSSPSWVSVSFLIEFSKKHYLP